MDNIVLRKADVSDARAIAVVHRRSRVFVPVLHTPEEDLEFFRDRELPRSVVWVAEVGEDVVGFLAREGEWIHHLFVLPEFQGIGVGSQLLAEAKLESPSGLRLYTFQENTRARAFYEARGFTNVEFNDAGGEEQLPDVLMEWRQSTT